MSARSGDWGSQPWVFGSVLGLFGGCWIRLVELFAAYRADHLWALEAPWAGLALYGLIGLGLGALAGAVLELVRRALFSSADPRLFVAIWLGLGGYLLQGLVTIQGLPGRNRLAWGTFLVVVAALALIAIRWLGRSPERSRSATLVLGGSIFAVEFSVGYVIYLFFIADQQAPRWMAGSVAVVAALVLGGFVGLVASARWSSAESRRIVAWLAPVAILLLAGLYVSSRGPEPTPETVDAEGPNVLMIVVDTLRRDAVSAYGLVSDVTPNLDRVAARGVLWTDLVATSNWTIPTHASLFTGAQVTRHGTGAGGRGVLRRLPAGPGTLELPTLAEVLRERGWDTTAFVCNANVSRANAFDRGFDQYHEIWKISGHYGLLGKVFSRIAPESGWDSGGEITTRALQSFLARASGRRRPWFAFVNYVEPHAPYAPPEPWRSKFAAEPRSFGEAMDLSKLALHSPVGPFTPAERDALWELYLGSVAYQDHLLGEVFDALDARGLADDTIVMVTSDHGENFGWEGHLGHGQGLNDDLIRLPLVARGPGLPQSIVVDDPVSLVDVMPSTLALLDVEVPMGDPGRTGAVMPPVGPALPPDRPRLVERYRFSESELQQHLSNLNEEAMPFAGHQRALLTGPLKLALAESGRPPQLSRLESPPRPPFEDGRVVFEDTDLLLELERMLNELLGSWTPANEAEEPEGPIDERTRKQLEALGYIGN